MQLQNSQINCQMVKLVSRPLIIAAFDSDYRNIVSFSTIALRIELAQKRMHCFSQVTTQSSN